MITKFYVIRFLSVGDKHYRTQIMLRNESIQKIIDATTEFKQRLTRKCDKFNITSSLHNMTNGTLKYKLR